MLVLTIECSQL